jgi:mannose-6-phosphate isomerase-like protein (cupin superfamily)
MGVLMYNKITETHPIDSSIKSVNKINMNIKIIRNFTMWQSVKEDDEIHVVIAGDPVINMGDKITTLHEGDILEFHKDEHYRYFSSGNSIIYCFKSTHN